MKLFFIGIAGIITTILLTIFGVYWYTPMEDQKPISVQEKIQKLIQGTSPGVVTVLRLHLTGEGVGSREVLGTGVIITTDGIVVTSHHVVDSRDYAYSVETTDGSVYMVEVLYQDSINDISYLRMLTEKSNKKIFEIVPIAHENRLKKNDIILSFDASGDVGKRATTFGQVKSLGETIKIDDDSEKVLKNLIKSDIRLEPGSSGGPIIDMSGDIVGINTAYINQGEKQGWHTPLTQEKIQKFLDHIDQGIR